MLRESQVIRIYCKKRKLFPIKEENSETELFFSFTTYTKRTLPKYLYPI